MALCHGSVILCVLSSALLLGSIVSSEESAIEEHGGNPKCRGLTNESGMLMVDCSLQGLMSVPTISPSQLVHILDMSHNILHKLHNDSFHPYPILTRLILSSDSITEIEVNTFSRLRALRKVDLSYNSLTSIHPNMFIHNTKLESLSLQGNPLRLLESRTPFLISTSLRSLDLSHCHLSELNEESLSQLPELKILNLSHNSLKQLLMNSMSALFSLHLVGNPWQCDCHFHSILMWISANPMVDSDVGTDKTVQCWQGDSLRSLTTRQEQDSICKVDMGHPTSQKITPESAVVSSNKNENIHSREEGAEFGIETLLDDVSSNYDELGKDSGLSSVSNKHGVWIYEDENLDISSSDDEDFEEMHKDNIPSSAAEVPMDLNLTVTVKVGENHNEINREESINSTNQFSGTHGFIPEDIGVGFDEFYGDYEYSGEMDKDITLHLPAEIHSLDHQNEKNVSMKIRKNLTEISKGDEIRDSTSKFLSYGSIPEDTDDYELYEYDEIQDSEELYEDISLSSSEITNLTLKDDNLITNAHYILENSDLQELDTKHQTAISTSGFSSQNNDSVMDGIASDSRSLRVPNSHLTSNDKDDTLNNSHGYEYKCISCGDNNALPSIQIPSLKNESAYEFAETSIFFENISSEETAIEDKNTDYTIQFPSIYDDFNPEDEGDPFAFVLDDLDSIEVANNETLPFTTNHQDLIEEDNFDIDRLIASVLKSFYSEENIQEHTPLKNQINDKPLNGLNLRIFMIIKFLIVAGMVSVIVFMLIVTIYCVSNICLTSMRSRQVIGYNRMEKNASKDVLLQNV
ncbi:uncharacterized protein LOC110839182 [Zootermopsis nevadensis]|nr:uncharacterized protein LOC110839182 [Zootermopsis nevadensis]XP_021938784.1 uncharacterized protein LOC110839182 [Zootermopsis nevadensis]XP_021938785.1 uncharacterized protein LOC110839182 [Zootermopsis nevadensis]XP_021938787.1 uncharacterized protein LOC110839182 [Zootermopsis nevadensis]XP_021938788.1 uncharacterized protein LOC110839182 [Zootermopsis nevadensis]